MDCSKPSLIHPLDLQFNPGMQQRGWWSGWNLSLLWIKRLQFLKRVVLFKRTAHLSSPVLPKELQVLCRKQPHNNSTQGCKAELQEKLAFISGFLVHPGFSEEAISMFSSRENKQFRTREREIWMYLQLILCIFSSLALNASLMGCVAKLHEDFERSSVLSHFAAHSL